MTYLTEDEARREACPLIRYCYNEAHVIQDGAQAIYVHQNCQGSDCKIGWRWRPERDGARRVGFCGAFGRPEGV